MILGAHVSAAGGARKAFERAQAIGAECLQIFTRAPSQWSAAPLRDVEEFRATHRAHGSPLLFAHDLYLSNLAAADELVRRRSIESQIVEMRRCQQLGIQALVCHMGSHPDPEVGLARLSEAITEVLAESPTEVQMLLETCAGQGNCLGHRFEQLAYCLERNFRLGVCLDTCHVYVAGYDISTVRGSQQTWKQFDTCIGRDRLKLLHLNDSKKPCGSRVDRHEEIGQGEIGRTAFARLLRDAKLAHLPAILETPGGEAGMIRNLELLKQLRDDPART